MKGWVTYFKDGPKNSSCLLSEIFKLIFQRLFFDKFQLSKAESLQGDLEKSFLRMSEMVRGVSENVICYFQRKILIFIISNHWALEK